MSSLTQFVSKTGPERILYSYANTQTLTANDVGYEILLNPAANVSVVALPNANTLSTGGEKFRLNNITDKTIVVRAADGTILAGLDSQGEINLHLANNSTAGGVWGGSDAVNLQNVIFYNDTTPITLNAGQMGLGSDSISVCKLSDNRALVVYDAVVSSTYRLYGRVATVSGNTVSVGSAVELHNSGSAGSNIRAQVVQLSTDAAALVFRSVSGSGTLYVYRVTTSGNSITLQSGQLTIATGDGYSWHTHVLNANTIAFTHSESATPASRLRTTTWNGTQWSSSGGNVQVNNNSQFGAPMIAGDKNNYIYVIHQPSGGTRFVQMERYYTDPANNYTLSGATTSYVGYDSGGEVSYQIGGVIQDNHIVTGRWSRGADTLYYSYFDIESNTAPKMQYYANTVVETKMWSDSEDLSYNSSLLKVSNTALLSFYYNREKTKYYNVRPIFRKNLEMTQSKQVIPFSPGGERVTNFINNQNFAIVSDSATDFGKILVAYSGSGSSNFKYPMLALVNFKIPSITDI